MNNNKLASKTNDDKMKKLKVVSKDQAPTVRTKDLGGKNSSRNKPTSARLQLTTS
jgi:hypothetical protein